MITKLFSSCNRVNKVLTINKIFQKNLLFRFSELIYLRNEHKKIIINKVNVSSEYNNLDDSK